MTTAPRQHPVLTRRALLRLIAASSAGGAFVACSENSRTEPADGGQGDGGQGDGGLDADGAADASDASDGADFTDAPPDVEPPPEYEYDGPVGPENLFWHGVASGDPLSTAVMLWTRVSPEGDGPVEVFWEMAYDPDFTRRVRSGTTSTSGERDFTVKIDADGLHPGTVYFYRFRSLGRASIVGRTRTAPTRRVRSLRFAVLSCSSYASGYFHVYRSVAERTDLDAVFHLGDYIYESGGGSGDRRHDPPREILTLADYRTRYAQYRRDPDLQAVHQQHPFIAVWDDHESSNDAYADGAENHDPATDGDWVARKAASQQAYFEWMPIRQTDDGRIWRSFSFGPLLDIVMLDTRLWGRDAQATPSQSDVINDPERTLLGDDQEQWLAETLRGSTAQWRLIGQQVMMAQLLLGGVPLNADQWDGYAGSRTRFLDVLEGDAVSNVVVLTGDIHTSWANDISRDPRPGGTYDPDTGEGSLAVEFVTPSVTSSSLSSVTPAIFELLSESNPHIRWAELTQKGYVVVDVDDARVQGAWFFVTDIAQPDYTEAFAVAFSSLDGQNHLIQDDAPAPAKDDAPPSAPGLVARA